MASAAGPTSDCCTGTVKFSPYAPRMRQPKVKRMRKSVAITSVLIIGVAFVASALYILRPGMLPHQNGSLAASPSSKQIARGEYLSRAGDCVACHTVPNGPMFAGGRAMATPFGNLYVPNITPDDNTGIGMWSADEFYRMMHTGISRDGKLLYPAMPFASYTQVTRGDSDAIFAYLMSNPPVKQKKSGTRATFSF